MSAQSVIPGGIPFLKIILNTFYANFNVQTQQGVPKTIYSQIILSFEMKARLELLLTAFLLYTINKMVKLILILKRSNL